MLSLEVVRWNSRNIIPFRLAVGRYDAENQVCTSLSDQVGVQTHVMMGIGDRQATPWHTTLNSPNLIKQRYSDVVFYVLALKGSLKDHRP